MKICSIYNYSFIIFLITLIYILKRNSIYNLELSISDEVVEFRNYTKNNFRDICLKNNNFIKDKCKINM